MVKIENICILDKDKSAFERIHKIFSNEGFNIMIAGGAARDIILGRNYNDIDFATDATPDDMVRIAKKNGIKIVPTGIDHGTVTFVIDHETYEVTTLRVDKNCDGRHAEVEFCTSYEEDAKRRDFTINAMFIDINNNIIDYVGGIDDCRNNIIRFVGNPKERIEEDYLRVIRAFRFKAVLGFDFEEDTAKALSEDHTEGMSNISAERYWVEFKKILRSNSAVIKDIIDQPYGKIFHLKNCALDVHGDIDYIFKLSQFCYNNNVNNVIDFFKMSKEERERLIYATTYRSSNEDSYFYIKQIIEGKKLELVSELLKFNCRLFGGDLESKYEVINEQINYYSRMMNLFPVKGNDLIDLGYKSGPELGNMLKTLRNVWIKSEFNLSKKALLELAK